MTNGDKWRSMTDEEIVKFLYQIQQNSGFEVEGFCKNHCEKRIECENSDCCINWENPVDLEWWVKADA